MQPNFKYVWFDWAMKHILRDKANFEILEGFISVMIGQQMKVLEILESESNQDNAATKFNRVDIKARNDKGETVIIEVQNIREMDFLGRILFGVAKAVTEQVSMAHSYGDIKKVYSISVVYFDFGQGEDNVYHGQTRLRCIHTDDELIMSQRERGTLMPAPAEEVFLEYFIIRVKKFDVAKSGRSYMEQWMEYLTTGNILRDSDAPGLKKARERLEFDKMAPAQQKRYWDHLDDIRIQQDAIDDSREEGREEGYMIGREACIAEGLAKGLEQGREESKLEIARKMQSSGIDKATISNVTGIPEDAFRVIF